MKTFFHALLAAYEPPRELTDVGETLIYTLMGRPSWAYSSSAKKYWIGSTKDTVNGTTQHITQYDEATNNYLFTQVGTVYEKDDHNQTQILIRESDSRIMVFYAEHNGSRLRYRISTNPLDSSSFGAEQTINPVSQYSYPSPYQAFNGDIFLFFRAYSDGFKWYYIKSSDNGATWSSATLFFNNDGAQAYLISNQHGNNIHFIATNGHPQSSNFNVNVYHFYFNLSDEKAYTSSGVEITLNVSPLTATLVKQATGNDTTLILDIVFKNNLPRVVFTFYPEGRSASVMWKIKQLYFIEFDGENWVNETFVSQMLDGYMEDDTSIQEYSYCPNSRFDQANPDIIWMPKQVNGILELHMVDISKSPIYIEQKTFNSEVDNWRPISVPSKYFNVIWLKKNEYIYYTDYSSTLMAMTVNVPNPE